MPASGVAGATDVGVVDEGGEVDVVQAPNREATPAPTAPSAPRRASPLPGRAGAREENGGADEPSAQSPGPQWAGGRARVSGVSTPAIGASLFTVRRFLPFSSTTPLAPFRTYRWLVVISLSRSHRLFLARCAEGDDREPCPQHGAQHDAHLQCFRKQSVAVGRDEHHLAKVAGFFWISKK